IAAHPRLARDARGDDDDIGICRLLVAVGADDQRIVAEHWASLEDIECLALRHIGNHIHQHDIGVVALCHSLAQRRAYVPGADNGYFAAHVCLSILCPVAASRSTAPLRRHSLARGLPFWKPSLPVSGHTTAKTPVSYPRRARPLSFSL